MRCSVASFGHVAEVVNDSALVATVPSTVASFILRLYPQLRAVRMPIALQGAPMELLWPRAVDDDEACRFVREHLVRIAGALAEPRHERVRRARSGSSPARGAIKAAARARDR